MSKETETKTNTLIHSYEMGKKTLNRKIKGARERGKTK